MKLRNLRPDQVKVPSTRVTSYFDSEIYAEFKRSIAAQGILQPIVVVEVGEEFYLVDGLHRLIEARDNGDPTVPTVVIPGGEKDVFLSNLFLNVLRGKQKVQEMRQVIDKLFSDFAMDPDAIGKATGLSREFIEGLLIISKLPEEVVAAFDAEKLEKGKALALARLPTPELQLRTFYQIDGRNLKVADVEEVVSSVLKMVTPETPAPAPVAETPPQLVPCSTCQRDYDYAALKTIYICPDCESILRYELRRLEREAQEPTEDGTKAPSG